MDRTQGGDHHWRFRVAGPHTDQEHAKTVAAALAEALARRLGEVVPDLASVSAEGSHLLLSARERLWAVVDFEPIINQEGDLRENVTTAARSALDRVQDFIVEELKGGWPASSPTKLAELEGGVELPLPGVAVEHESVRLWFGDERHPSVEFPAIALRDLDI